MIIQTETNDIQEFEANDIQEFVKKILDFDIGNNDVLYFRGEGNDYQETALQPSIYRNPKHLENEHCIYREIQRFNDYEFTVDKSAFDRLSRMQHYTTPTRLIDLSEDALTALHFAISTRKCPGDAVVYVVAIKKDKIKYYDSDTVSVISNLAKIPLINGDVSDKSKASIARDAEITINSKSNKYKLEYFIEKYNELDSTKFLLHEIKEEKGYFSSIINPEHIFSIQCVKPKLSNTRIYGQKGAFLLFGLNRDNIEKAISIIKYDKKKSPSLLDNKLYTHPITKIMKIKIDCNIKLKTLEKLGITTPYIYTGIDKISEYFRDKYA